MSGIFILEGMLLSITKFSIIVKENGEVEAEGPEISVGYDACIAWARIALTHRECAEQNMAERRKVWSDESQENLRSQVIEDEFRSSMQSVVSAVTCIEALYDHLTPYSPIGNKTKASWRTNRTARYVQVSETLRTTLRIRPIAMNGLRHNLKAMYRLRDASVHPSSRPRPPYKHPELDIATDWRFTVFRGDVADYIVYFVLGLLWDITHGFEYRTEELSTFMDGFRTRVEKLLPQGRPDPKMRSVSFKLP